MISDPKQAPPSSVPLDPVDLEAEPIPVSAPAYPLYEETDTAKPVKRRFRHWFPVILGVYFLFILGAGAVALSSLSRFLTRYEAGQDFLKSHSRIATEISFSTFSKCEVAPK